MTKFLYIIVGLIAKIHTYILKINDTYEYALTDKQLHFLVIGFLGIGLVLVIHPVFKYLAKHNHILTITGIYVFTLIVVITFAIEIGQKITNTGNMEFSDILYGITGFVIMFFCLSAVIGFFKFIASFFISNDDDDEK